VQTVLHSTRALASGATQSGVTILVVRYNGPASAPTGR
jgi:hypothetical protein